MNILIEDVEPFRGTAPDIGTTFTYEGNDYRVDGWIKDAKDQSDAPTSAEIATNAKRFGMGYVLDQLLKGTHERHGPKKRKLVWCAPKDAEYVSGVGVSGVIAPIDEITITGRVQWDKAMIDDERKFAMMRIGEPI